MRQATTRLTLLLAALALVGCGDSPSAPPAHGVDLNRLFAPPTAAEKAAIEAEWAARSPSAEDVQVVRTQPFAMGGATLELRIVSHAVDGHRHYGAILTPQQAPSQPLPITLYLHGGDEGVAVEELSLLTSTAGLDPLSAVWVIPSFRSEPLRLGSQVWLSGGAPSPWDRDVDDTLALLDVAADLVPFARRDCVGSIGLSRGGGVGLLLSARDPNQRATVEFFGPTDFFGSYVRGIVEEALAGAMRPLPGLTHLNTEWIQPLRLGQVTYEQTRLAMLRRSAAHFAPRLGPVQVHHGTADNVVAVSQAYALRDAMTTIGRGVPDFETFIYLGIGHNAFTMIGAPARVRQFLGRLDNCPA